MTVNACPRTLHRALLAVGVSRILDSTSKYCVSAMSFAAELFHVSLGFVGKIIVGPTSACGIDLYPLPLPLISITVSLLSHKRLLK